MKFCGKAAALESFWNFFAKIFIFNLFCLKLSNGNVVQKTLQKEVCTACVKELPVTDIRPSRTVDIIRGEQFFSISFT